jgi:hypothetical protein
VQSPEALPIKELTVLAAQRRARTPVRLMSGVALVVFEAGLILSNRAVRQSVAQVGPGHRLSAAIPDIERYLKLWSM